MSKKVYLKTNKISKIKEMLDNNVSLSGIVMKEAKPEVDEFEIGGEGGDNLVGGEMYHVNESRNFSREVDLSDVGEIHYSWYYDEDDYNEWLNESNLQDSEESRMAYIEDYNVSFDLDYYDNQTYHFMDRDEVYYDDLEDLFGEKIAEMIIGGCIKSNEGKGKFDTVDIYSDSNYDINNPQELNDIATKLLPHGGYYDGCRGFILSDGVIVYTEGEHNDVLIIPNVKSKFDFVRLGNIRILPNAVDIGKEPTYEQYEVLRKILNTYEGEEFYLDIYINDSSCFSAQYDCCNPKFVLGEIDRYYSEGIKPQGNKFYESTSRKKKIVIPESKIALLTEDQASTSIGKAKELLMARLGYDKQQADEFVRIKLRNDFPSLRTKKGGKFIYGVTRMFLDGQIRDASTISNLNSTLELVASDAHIKEYDRDLNGLSAQELISRFEQVRSGLLDDDKQKLSQMQFDVNNDYEIVRIDSFEDAQEYYEYTNPKSRWCLTHMEDMYDSYTSEGMNQIYFCLKHGFEDIEPIKGDNAPLDEYGLSMLSVIVDGSGSLLYCTCRWNHGNGGSDSVMNTEEISKVIGVNFYDVFKPNNKWKELVESCLYDINVRKKNPDVVFDDVNEFNEGLMVVGIEGKYNYIYKSNNGYKYLIPNKWFENASDFSEGLASVEYERDLWGYIDKNGNEACGGKRFYDAYDFSEGLASVKYQPYSHGYIDRNGNDICGGKRFKYAYPFSDGLGTVRYNDDSMGYIDRNGNEACGGKRFEYAYFFSEGLACVQYYDSPYYYFIDKTGENALKGQCFVEAAYGFKEGLACVKLENGLWNFVDKNGDIVFPDRKFSSVGAFYDGLANVRLTNGLYYKIDKNGVLYNKSTLPPIKESIDENIEFEVKPSEVDLSSFKKKDNLVPSIWNGNKLDSRVRLKLLDIADDFWEFVNLTWVEPKGIILTGSICNFNWSNYSDIDLHLVVDFNDIDDKTEFVRDYLDSKKNEWNNEHDGLNIFGYQVELYVQNVGEMPESSGIYDIEENDWIVEPSKDDIKPIGLNKYNIKDKAAEIMTIIDDMYDFMHSTDDSHKIEQVGDDAKYLWDKIKTIRKDSLETKGESGSGNIIYKLLRRKKYLDKLWKLRTIVYDKINSISENKGNNKNLLKEYLDKNYNAPLVKYFQWADKASDYEKSQDLAYECSWSLDRYIDLVSNRYEEFDDIDCGLMKYGDDTEIEKFLQILKDNKLLSHFISSMGDIVDYVDLPTWMTTDYEGVVKNEWCIHFTKNADKVATDGFTSGTDDISRLAYTGAGKEKYSEGYNFAYLLNEKNVDFNEYGKEAVIFRTSGVKIFHYGDNESQVIFWGPHVRNLIPIKYDDVYYGEWCIFNKSGEVLYHNKYPSEIAKWAINNYEQYRKQIVVGKDGIMPRRYNFDLKKSVPYGKALENPYPFSESVKKYIAYLKDKLLSEEVVADGSAERNPYSKRWREERKALKNFLVNFGRIMTSRENGKQYKVYYDESMSQLIGYNYCICIQWDEVTMKPGSVIYIRALDKFTNRLFKPQFDYRGRDNIGGTTDDVRRNNLRY